MGTFGKLVVLSIGVSLVRSIIMTASDAARPTAKKETK